MEQRWRRYPHPLNEERQLELYRCLMEATQALLDKVSQPKPKEKEGISLETYKTKEEGIDRHPLQTPREEESP